MKIVIINGPNLNLLGRREVSIYGTRSMEQVLVDIQRAYPEVYFEYRQSNHEGDLIRYVNFFFDNLLGNIVDYLDFLFHST